MQTIHPSFQPGEEVEPRPAQESGARYLEQGRSLPEGGGELKHQWMGEGGPLSVNEQDG